MACSIPAFSTRGRQKAIPDYSLPKLLILALVTNQAEEPTLHSSPLVESQLHSLRQNGDNLLIPGRGDSDKQMSHRHSGCS